jgi:cell division protein ZipA
MSTFSLRIWLTIIGISVIGLVFLLNYRKQRSQQQPTTNNNRAAIPTQTNEVNATHGVAAKSESLAKQQLPQDAPTASDQIQTVEDNATNAQEEDNTTNAQEENNTTNAQEENNTTNAQVEDNTTNAQEEDNTTNAQEENNTTNAQEENTEIQQQLVVINLQHIKQPFSGAKVIDALCAEGLSFGDMQIFHYCDPTSDANIFSASNAIEPGTLVPQDMENTHTPAISLFFDLAQPDPINTFALLLEKARNLAAKLDAKILDDERNLMTEQTIGHYQDKITNYARLHHSHTC